MVVNHKGNKYRDKVFTHLIWSKEKIYPLIKRFYHGLMINTPCDIEFTLKELFGDIGKCRSHHMSHIKVIGYPTSQIQTIPCRNLTQYYPFVERNKVKLKNVTIFTERLKFQRMVLDVVRYSVPNVCTDKISFYPSDLIYFYTKIR